MSASILPVSPGGGGRYFELIINFLESPRQRYMWPQSGAAPPGPGRALAPSSPSSPAILHFFLPAAAPAPHLWEERGDTSAITSPEPMTAHDCSSVHYEFRKCDQVKFTCVFVYSQNVKREEKRWQVQDNQGVGGVIFSQFLNRFKRRILIQI